MAKKTYEDLIEEAGKREEQQELFESLFIEEVNWSHTLEVFDALPKFNYQKKIRLKETEIIERKCQHRGRDYLITLKPAVVSVERKALFVFPGKREEMVLFALRYLAGQNLVKSELTQTKSGKKVITLNFTIYQLRKELTRMNHGYKVSELNEALEVLRGAELSIVSGEYKFSESMIFSVGEREDLRGSRQISFHPLASQAILSGATRLIRYDKFMSLKHPLSRWLYMRFCHLITNAQQTTPLRKGIGLKFTYTEVFEQSGVQPRSRKRDNLKLIRQALDELKETGIAQNDDMGEAWTEDLGREEWAVYPSNQTVSDIIKATKLTTTRPQDNLTLED